MKKILIITYSTLSTLLWSCVTGTEQTNAPELPIATLSNKTPTNFTINSFYVQTPDNVSYFDFMEMYTKNNPNEFFNRETKIEGIEMKIRQAKTWQESHLIAQNFITSEVPRLHLSFDVHQNLASAMLYYTLFDVETSVESQKAIEYYLNILLLYNNYYETDIIARSLIKLSGYWSKDKISNLSKKIVDNYVLKTGRRTNLADIYFQYYGNKVKKVVPDKFSNISSNDISSLERSKFTKSVESNKIPELLIDLDGRKNSNLRIGLEHYYGLAIIQLLADNSSK